MKTLISKLPFLILVIIIFGILCRPQVSAAEQKPTIEVSPQKIEIHSFYHGTQIEVRGTAPAASKVALVLTSEEKEYTLTRKGRVGPLWMNVETVTIQGTPEMYYLATSSETPEELGQPEALARCRIGYDALRKSAEIKQNGPDCDSTFCEFIKLKEDMGLYKSSYGFVKLTPREEGKFASFAVSIPIPPTVAPGEYRISMFCFENCETTSNVSTTLTVEKVGLPKMLSALAFNHSAVYGIVAVAVAIAAGLFMGFLFGSKGKGGH